MTLIEWDPFRNIEALQERINRLFDDSFPGVGRKPDNTDSKGVWKPATDIYETEDAVVITAELPGVAKKDVSIEVKGAKLTISGKRHEDKWDHRSCRPVGGLCQMEGQLSLYLVFSVQER